MSGGAGGYGVYVVCVCGVCGECGVEFFELEEGWGEVREGVSWAVHLKRWGKAVEEGKRVYKRRR